MSPANDEAQRKELIKSAVKEALEELGFSHVCLHSLTKADATALKHLSIYLKTIGDGDLDKGVDVFRDQHKFIQGYMSVAKTIGSYILAGILGAILVVLGNSIVRGVVDFVRQQK